MLQYLSTAKKGSIRLDVCACICPEEKRTIASQWTLCVCNHGAYVHTLADSVDRLLIIQGVTVSKCTADVIGLLVHVGICKTSYM